MIIMFAFFSALQICRKNCFCVMLCDVMLEEEKGRGGLSHSILPKAFLWLFLVFFFPCLSFLFCFLCLYLICFLSQTFLFPLFSFCLFLCISLYLSSSHCLFLTFLFFLFLALPFFPIVLKFHGPISLSCSNFTFLL